MSKSLSVRWLGITGSDSFHVGLLFSTFRLSNKTMKNNANFVSSKCTNFDEAQFFNICLNSQCLAHMICRHLNIMHSSMNYCLCSFIYLIFVLNCITGSGENYASHCLWTKQTCMGYFRYAIWKMISWQQANLHENWSIQTLFYSILNISAKCHQHRSL